jgi:hypothetical protein
MDPRPSLPPGPRPRIDWRRLTRSPRGAAGLVILAAALLLWPFAGLSWIPWLVGLGVLVLIHLVRLDGLLRGWAPHAAGLAVVIGLMMSTGPWAWALALSIGVLLAGLAQLPWWRLAAVGAVLCVISGLGFGISTQQEAAQIAAAEAQTQIRDQGAQGAARPNGVLPVLLNRMAQNVPGPICDNLLSEPARAAFVAAQGATDCVRAVSAVASRVVDRQGYSRADAPTTPNADGMIVDACMMTWRSASPKGPQLGKLTIGRKPGGSTYMVTAFTAC